MIPDNFIQDLKFRSDIADIVSSYTNLKRHGKNYVSLCPFHNEKTASFYIYPESGSFYCFGCGAGGDIITFIQKAENLDYIDAIKLLAKRSGLELPEDNNIDNTLSELKRRIYEANRISAKIFYENLYKTEGKAALEYLRKRGLSDQTIRRFGLGYSVESRFELINYLRGKGFSLNDITQANLAVLTKKGTAIDRFNGRIMFPIIDLRGNVIAFGGRAIDSNEKAKYINTSDTPVFKKSNNLFALNFAKNEKDEKFILVEGYMDAIALNQAGFKNTVATLGTALTMEQAKLMGRYKNEVVICYDSDQAGQKASARAIDTLRSAGVIVKILTIPKGKDPDEFIKSYGDQGAPRFKQLLQNCDNDIDYQLEKLKKVHNVQSSEGKVAYIKAASLILAKIQNSLEKEVYAIKLAEFVGVDKSIIINQIKKEKSKYNKINEKKEFKQIYEKMIAKKDIINPQKGENLRAAIAEEALIAYLINRPEYAHNIFLRLPCDSFITDFNKRVYKCLFERVKNSRAIGLTDLTQDFNVNEISKISGFLASWQNSFLTDGSVNDYINVILNEKAKINAEKMNLVNDDLLDYVKKLKDEKK